MSKYKQALDRPTAKGGRGWKYADEDSVQAVTAQALGARHCLNPEAVYDWADRHGVNLFERRKDFDESLENYEGFLMILVLNDYPIEKLEEIKQGIF